MSAQVTGIAELDRALAALPTKVARKVTRTATNAGLTTMAKGIRQAISETPGLSPQLRRAMKRAVGKRFKKSRPGSDAMSAKAGFGVGKKLKSRTAKRSGKNKGGVGISAANVHWFLLGTNDRFKKSGRYVGKIGAIKIIQAAYKRHGRAAFEQIKIAGLIKLEDEIRKLKT